MAKKDVTFSPAEFKQLPLDYVISAPLMSTINAHKLAAQTSLEYIRDLAEAESQTFKQTVNSESIDDNGVVTTAKVEKTMDVPLLALAKVPNLNFDSLSIDFEYTISQVYKQEKEREFSLGLSITGSKFLSKFVDVGLKGSISTSKSTENTINKSGTLKIKLHASEAPLPEGLNKVLGWLVQSIEEAD